VAPNQKAPFTSFRNANGRRRLPGGGWRRWRLHRSERSRKRWAAASATNERSRRPPAVRAARAIAIAALGLQAAAELQDPAQGSSARGATAAPRAP
jgi:hypothetical protein